MSTLSVLSALFAIPAAVLWFMSARVETPEHFNVHVVGPDSPMGLPLGGNPMGGVYVGQAYSRELVALAEALSKQSRLSAYAAGCAGVSALLQAVTALL